MTSKIIAFALNLVIHSIFRSVINTWERDWGRLKWGQVPDQLQANIYLSHQVEKEEWEDEMLMEWTRRRRGSIEDDDDFVF